MTRSKSPFDHPPNWQHPAEQVTDQPGADPYLNWPSQQQGYDPRYQPPQPPPMRTGFEHQQGYHLDPNQGVAGPEEYQQGYSADQPFPPGGPGYGDPNADYNHPSQSAHGYCHPNYDTPLAQPTQYDTSPTQPPQLAQPVPQYGGYNDPQQPPQLRPATYENIAEPIWPDPAAGADHNWQARHDIAQHDPSPYDLGNYKPVGQPGDRPAFGEPGYMPGQHWDNGTQAYHETQLPQEQQFDPRSMPVTAPEPGAVAQHDEAYGDEEDYDDYDDYDEYEEEGAGGTRKFIIAAALVSTIVVGGGFAYGYNVMFSGAPAPAGTPVVKAQKMPAKIQPAEPGGRKFEHTNSKLMEKLGNGSQATLNTTNPDDSNSNRVRSVSTLVVGRDGRLIVPEAPQSSGAPAIVQTAPTESAADSDSSAVPGLTIVGGEPPPIEPQSASVVPSIVPAAATTSAPAATPPIVPQSSAPQQPAQPATTRRRRSKFPPLPVRSGVAKRTLLAAVRPVNNGVTQANVRRVVPQNNNRQAGLTRAAPRTVPAAPAAGAASGYVAVLSTKRSRIDALTSFADLQQRYGTILSAKVPDVRRADLSSRGLGVMYRAVVGPPGSRQIATRLCSRLKTAGYAGCWVSAY